MFSRLSLVSRFFFLQFWKSVPTSLSLSGSGLPQRWERRANSLCADNLGNKHDNLWELLESEGDSKLFPLESDGHHFPCNYTPDSRCKKKSLRRVYTSKAASQHPSCLPIVASHRYCRHSCQVQWNSKKCALSLQRIARSYLYAPPWTCRTGFFGFIFFVCAEKPCNYTVLHCSPNGDQKTNINGSFQKITAAKCFPKGYYA